MAELLNQIFALSKTEQLQIMAAMIEHLQTEETDIPAWQVQAAGDALSEIEQNPGELLSQEDFWTRIDAKVSELEGNNEA